MTSSLRCSSHPGQPAGWRCTGCGALLCPACTVVLRVGSVECDGCARCRGLAERLRVRRQEARPFAGRIAGAFAYPFHRGSLLAIFGLALAMRVLGFFGLLAALLGKGIYWAFLFGVIVQTWKGKEELEPPDFTNLFDDLLYPALRGVAATALIWLPALLRAISLVAGVGSGSDDPTAIVILLVEDPAIWALLFAGAAFAPAALLAAAISRSLLAVINPLVPIQMARALGWDYVWATLTTTGLAIAGLVLERVAGATVGRLPVVGGLLTLAVAAYFPIVSARILGLLAHVRGDDLDLGQASDYLEPVLPGASPQGGLVELEPAPRRPRAEDGGLRDGPPPIARAVAIDLDPEPSPDPWVPSPQPPLSPFEELRAALATGELERAYALYRQAGGRIEGLGAGDLFQLARGAAKAGDHPVAAWALTSAAAFRDDPVAPDVLLVLGRIYRSRLGKGAEARQTFEALIARYPESAAAQHARRELEESG